MVRASVLFRPWKTCLEHASLTLGEVGMFIFHWSNSHTTIAMILVLETTKKIWQIKDRLKAACDCQISYTDKRRKPLEFSVGDHVLLKVSPWKEEIQVDTKLNFVEEPVEILEREIKKLKRSRIPIIK
ncbi:hypothetical protein Tco_1440801, partial [Tanacetum coccineum]